MFVHFSKYDSVLSMARLWICKGYSGCWICLNKPEYTLMSQHVWICLNNAEYKWICQHIPERNRVLNMPEFWMCLMQYIAYGHCTNYWTVIETDIFRTLSHYQTFKMEHFAKRMMSECRYATRNFLGQGGEGGCRTRALR